jgi:hypothetical protein
MAVPTPDVTPIPTYFVDTVNEFELVVVLVNEPIAKAVVSVETRTRPPCAI